MEPRRRPWQPFEEYYTKTPTHLWIHDLATGNLQKSAREIAWPARHAGPAAGRRPILIQVVRWVDKYTACEWTDDAREFSARANTPYG